MRERRYGTIVNISSIAARDAGSGYYSATKGALEGLSSGLRKEVSPLGITVIVVEPGQFRTDFYGRSLQQSQTVIADYAETAGHHRIENDTIDDHQNGDPARGAQLIVKAVKAQNPLSLLLLGAMPFKWSVVCLMQIVLNWKLGKRTVLPQISRLKHKQILLSISN